MRIAELSQALVGHVRGGLAQVTTVFSMFFSGMSGSSSADVAVLSRTMAIPMAREGYSPQFVAALIAAASTIAATWCRRASWRWSTAPSAMSRSPGCSSAGSCPA